jgi:A/G-specific adenine glycosylase
VSTVIPYFNNWISRWPTVQDLAKAHNDDVLSVWKGLGYYSRATRLHQGAQDMVAKYDKASCPIPSTAQELEDFSGIGKYTAGAISSIAFGRPEPVLDGNVCRVLSRQLGLFIDVKDKKSSDLLWEVADRLVKDVAAWPETTTSPVPGQWNQALMELGSTICTPTNPKCSECPIRETCRVYSEGEALLTKKEIATIAPDIEDLCFLCEDVDPEELLSIAEGNESHCLKPTKKKKAIIKPQNKISRYFLTSTPDTRSTPDTEDSDTSLTAGSKKRKAECLSPTSDAISTYCSLFPKRVAKKEVPHEECVVCMIEIPVDDGESKWLIEQRPAKGQ